MDMYQHDSATVFQFVLRGELGGDSVQDLEHAWTTAKSILEGKELVVDVSGITNADPSGVDLLSRMRESGARLTAALPPESEEILRSLGVPVAAPSGWRHKLAWRARQGLPMWIAGSLKRSGAIGGNTAPERPSTN
jgi:ABC-type transporter Mla MlaB component